MVGRLSSLGIGSGIDVESLLGAVRRQLELPIELNDRKAERAQNENTAIDRLSKLTRDIASTLDPLRTVNGGARAKKSESSNLNVGDAAAGSNAADGSVTVNVTQLASAGRATLERSFTSAAEAFGTSGSVGVTVGTGESAQSFSVAVDASTTAQGFVDSFNAQAGNAARASIVNTGSSSTPNLKIVISSQETGLEKGSIAATASFGSEGSGGTPVQSARAVDGSGTPPPPAAAPVSFTVTQATDLKLTIGGVGTPITSGSNTVDVAPGVSFKAKGLGSTTITTGSNTSEVAGKLSRFVQLYNETQSYIRTEDAVTPGESLGDSVSFGGLSGTSVDEELSSKLRSAVSSSGFSGGGLAELGITLQRDGQLSFDQKKFEQAYAADPDGAAGKIEKLASLSGIGGQLDSLTRYQGGFDIAQKKNLDELRDIERSTQRLQRRNDAQIARIERQFQELDKFAAKFSALGQALSGLVR